MARFEKGNKAAKGNRHHRGGGRPTNEQKEQERLEAEFARKRMEDHLKPVLDTYIALATGRPMKKGSRHLVDPATLRDYVAKFVPPAPKTLTLDLSETVEEFFDRIQNQGQKERP